MAKRDRAVTEKLDEIRGQLLGNPTHEDLQKMQLQVDLLNNIDVLMGDADPGHHHDHMDDHDHTALALRAVDIAQRAGGPG
jgi:hypothetical protein